MLSLHCTGIFHLIPPSPFIVVLITISIGILLGKQRRRICSTIASRLQSTHSAGCRFRFRENRTNHMQNTKYMYILYNNCIKWVHSAHFPLPNSLLVCLSPSSTPSPPQNQCPPLIILSIHPLWLWQIPILKPAPWQRANKSQRTHSTYSSSSSSSSPLGPSNLLQWVVVGANRIIGHWQLAQPACGAPLFHRGLCECECHRLFVWLSRTAILLSQT
jgi:hypothetical protein